MHTNMDREVTRQEILKIKRQIDGIREVLGRIEEVMEMAKIGGVPCEVIQGRGFFYHEVEELLEPILSALRLSSPVLPGAPHFRDLIAHIAMVIKSIMEPEPDSGPEPGPEPESESDFQAKKGRPCPGEIWEVFPLVGNGEESEVVYLMIKEVFRHPAGFMDDTYICYSAEEPHRGVRVTRSQLSRCVKPYVKHRKPRR